MNNVAIDELRIPKTLEGPDGTAFSEMAHLANDVEAALQARMSTDPPLGEVDYQPEEWDEDRVRDLDARRVAEGRRT